MSVLSPTKIRQPKTWIVLEAGPGKGMSIPEYFINKPHAFLKEFFGMADLEDDDVVHTDDVMQAEELISDLPYIHIPLRLKGKALAVQIIDPPRPFYFEIVDSDVFQKRWFSNFSEGRSVSTNIDLLAPYLAGVTAADLKHAVNHLVDAVEGQKAKLWERWECEAFFSNRKNVVALRDR